jgi:hypothetical protein
LTVIYDVHNPARRNEPQLSRVIWKACLVLFWSGPDDFDIFFLALEAAASFTDYLRATKW